MHSQISCTNSTKNLNPSLIFQYFIAKQFCVREQVKPQKDGNSSKDRTREILATVGAGVKRDPNRQVTEFEGKELKPANVDHLTQYWTTEVGRGKFRDTVENLVRSKQEIINIVTKKSESGEYNLIKNIISKSVVQKMERLGFVDFKGKTVEQIPREVVARFGGLTKRGIKVRFYGTKDMDLSGITKEQINYLMADGFAMTGDGLDLDKQGKADKRYNRLEQVNLA